MWLTKRKIIKKRLTSYKNCDKRKATMKYENRAKKDAKKRIKNADEKNGKKAIKIATKNVHKIIQQKIINIKTNNPDEKSD